MKQSALALVWAGLVVAGVLIYFKLGGSFDLPSLNGNVDTSSALKKITSSGGSLVTASASVLPGTPSSVSQALRPDDAHASQLHDRLAALEEGQRRVLAALEQGDSDPLSMPAKRKMLPTSMPLKEMAQRHATQWLDESPSCTCLAQWHHRPIGPWPLNH